VDSRQEKGKRIIAKNQSNRNRGKGAEHQSKESKNQKQRKRGRESGKDNQGQRSEAEVLPEYIKLQYIVQRSISRHLFPPH